jgi:hypothetical protein
MLRLEFEDLQNAAAGYANPSDLARGLIVLDAEKRPHPVGRRVGNPDERAAERFPVELHRFVEIRHRNAGVAK